MYKLIALDIDGTLLDPAGQVRPRVRQAVRQAVKAGVVVTLATGRRHRSARLVAQSIGLATPLILYSGSLVYDPGQEQALLHRPLSPAFVSAGIGLLREAGLSPGIFQSPLQGERIFLGPAEHDDLYLRDFATHPTRADLIERRPYARMVDIADPLVVMSAGSAAIVARLTEQINQNGQLACNLYSYSLARTSLPDLYGFDLLPPDHTKAYALKWLAAYYGFGLAQTMVVGDGANDLEMIRVAGLGVAMGNATPEVQAVADVIVGTNAQDGVAEAVERFVLNVL